ncbi:hypothetical protein BBD42_26075 [Paenibacillus sp. BIHB 4019]|uniref:LPXTG cell wall anchor domain-containing protein n=1 Tax=Paenibacillus sp. BIHB 4019 TaxID=1870819 RepID=A0A1B2DPD1_9BACL|nr:hypothetical protein [Paenibacillus sp. BIHB 4019]ANY69569.1 hypothetical protein BBD42_26075 [Paenibacillus sp. BIHB 4019]
MQKKFLSLTFLMVLFIGISLWSSALLSVSAADVCTPAHTEQQTNATTTPASDSNCNEHAGHGASDPAATAAGDQLNDEQVGWLLTGAIALFLIIVVIWRRQVFKSKR